MITDPDRITEEDKAFLAEEEKKKADQLKLASTSLVPDQTEKPVEQQANQEAAKTEAPKVPDSKEDDSPKTYEMFGIKPVDAINPFNKIKQKDFVNASKDQRDEIVSGVLAELNQNLLSDGITVPELRKKEVDGQIVEEIVQVPASEKGRLTKAGLDYYNQSSSLLSIVAKDENGGVRRNPLTGQFKSMVGSRLISPYQVLTPEEQGVVTDETGASYKPLTQEETVSYEHMREVYSARAQQAGMSFNGYLTKMVKDNESLFSFDNIRQTVSDVNVATGGGKPTDDMGLVAKIKDSPIDFTKENEQKLQAEFTKNLGRLKAEANMGDKPVDMYNGTPIFNPEKIKDLASFEEALLSLPISKTEKQSLLTNFKTNFEDQAMRLIEEQEKVAQFKKSFSDFGPLNKLPAFDQGRKLYEEAMQMQGKSTSPMQDFLNSGKSAYDYVKDNADVYKSNFISSGIQKLIISTYDSFYNTGTAAASLLGAGVELAAKGVNEILPSAPGFAIQEGARDFRKGVAASKSAFSEGKNLKYEQLGGFATDVPLPFTDETVQLKTDDIFDAIGNVVEMYSTLGSAPLLKAGTVATRKLGVKASLAAGKESAAKLTTGLSGISKMGVEFKEGAKALWQNAEVLNTAAGVLKTSLYGSFTSAGSGIGEGYASAIRAGKNEDEALMEATTTGMSNGLATFVAMTVMNGLLPSFGVEKGLIKASEGVGLRASIRNTIARNKSSKAISSALLKLVDDKTALSALAKGTVDGVKNFTKNQGILNYTASVAFGGITEGIEEWGDEMLAPVINAYLFKEESARKYLETNGYWLGAIKAGMIGVLMGTGTSLKTRTSENKKALFDLANKRIDAYFKQVVPNYKSYENDLVSVKSDTAEGGRIEATLRNILSTGTVAQQVEALTQLGTASFQQRNLDQQLNQDAAVDQQGSAPQGAAEIKTGTLTETPNIDLNAGTPVETKPQDGTPVQRQTFDISRTANTTSKLQINAPVNSDADIAAYAYNEAHGVDINESTDIQNPTLKAGKQQVFAREGAPNVIVTSYTLNDNVADLHSFQKENGDTIFVKKSDLGQALKKEFGNKIVLSNLSKVSNENKVAPLIPVKTPTEKNAQNTEAKPKQQSTQTPDVKPTGQPEIKPTEKPDSKSAEQPEAKPDVTPQEDKNKAPEQKPEETPPVEEKIEDIYDETKEVVGEKRLKPRLKKVFDKYKGYLKKKKIGVLVVNNVSELANIKEFGDSTPTGIGFAAILNQGKSNQRDVIIIVADQIEEFANQEGVSVETILEDAIEHENIHVVTNRYNRTREGSKLKKDFEQDLLDNKALNQEMEKDYPGFSTKENNIKFFEFVRAFVSGKITNRTLSAMMSISPSMAKWVGGFIKFAKKELKNYKGAKKYLAKFEKFYIEEIKDDAALFKYSPSSTQAFKDFISKIYNSVSPTKARAQGKSLTVKEIDYSNINEYVFGFNSFIKEKLTENFSPEDVVTIITGVINGYNENDSGLNAESKKVLFNEIVKDWVENEQDQNMIAALQNSANKIGSVETTPHINNPSIPATEAVKRSVEEKLAYNSYTRIRRTISDYLVVKRKTDALAKPAPVDDVKFPAETRDNPITNAYVVGKIDKDTGQIISLGLTEGDVVSVLNSKGEVVEHLVYSLSEIVVNENGSREAQHRFISGVISQNGVLSKFGNGLQTLFTEKFRNDFEESGLVDKIIKSKDGSLEIDNIDELLQFVFSSLTNKSINPDGEEVNSIEVNGKSYTFDDLFTFDVSNTVNDSNASPFYYKNGKIVVNTAMLKKEFSFINENAFKDADNKRTIGLLVTQAVRTAIDEELLHHITILTFDANDILAIYDELINNDRFKGLITQIASAQGIKIGDQDLTEQERYVIGTEFLAFINQKSFDGSTYADEYSQLLSTYSRVTPDGKALITATTYGRRYRDMLVSRAATSLMSPRLIGMINKLSVVKRATTPRKPSSVLADSYLGYNEETYIASRDRMQKIIDNAFLKQFAAVNDLRSALSDIGRTAIDILDFNFENNTVNLTQRFRDYYKNKVTEEELKELDDYFSRLNKDSVVRELVSTLSAAKARLDALTEEAAANINNENVNPEIGALFRQARKDYDDLVLDYADIILNKNLTKVDEFGRSFAVIGSELGGETTPVFTSPERNTITLKFDREFNGVNLETNFTYDVNLFGYENQTPLNAIQNRSAQRLRFDAVEGDVERAKLETTWIVGYRGRFTTNDRNNFPNKVLNIEGNAAFLGEEEFNYFYISKINGQSFDLKGVPYSYSDFRNMMGFNPIDFRYNESGEKVLKDLNEVINKFVIPDTEIETGVVDSNTKIPLVVTMRTASQSKLISEAFPDRQKNVLTQALKELFYKDKKSEKKNIVEWFNNLEELIGYERSNGNVNVVPEVAGRETFASKFAKQLKFRMFSDRRVYGSGVNELIQGETEEDPSLYAMLREFQAAYYALFPSIQRPSDVKAIGLIGTNELTPAKINNLLQKLPAFLEAIDALNQDIGLARKAYSRFTSRYLANTIIGDIRLIQEQDTDGIRANTDLIKAIQDSYYDIQGMENIEFLMEHRLNGGRQGINGILALNLLDQLASIPSSAQNEYYVTNTPSEKVSYLLELYTAYVENKLNPRVKDTENKSTFPTDNLVFNVLQKHGDRLEENDEQFNADLATKPSDTAETVSMSGVSPVTGRDEATQEAIDSARRAASHEEVKKIKNWVFQAAIAVFQNVIGNGNTLSLNGVDTARAKKFFYLFAKTQNRPNLRDDFTDEQRKQHFKKIKSEEDDLIRLMLEQLNAIHNHYRTRSEANSEFEAIAKKVRKFSYSHPMEFLVDVVEVIGSLERGFLSELTEAGKTLAEYAQAQLQKEAAIPEGAISLGVDNTMQAPVKATAYIDTTQLESKLAKLLENMDRATEDPFVSKSVIDKYRTAIAEVKAEIDAATAGVAAEVEGLPVSTKRYVKKDTSELTKQLAIEESALALYNETLAELKKDKAKESDISGVEKEIKNQTAKIKSISGNIKKIQEENELAENQPKTEIEKLDELYQSLRTKLYTAREKTTTDEAGNVIPQEAQRDAGEGQVDRVSIKELAADPEIETSMREIGVMIAKLQRSLDKPKSMLTRNQEQAQLVLDSLREDAEKGQLGAGTIFYARTFKFKSDQSLIDDRLFFKSPLFSALIQSMPNLIVYQPNINYENKKNSLPDGAGIVKFANGDHLLYITNSENLNASKQAEILISLIVSQINTESDNGKRPSVLKQTIDEMADIIRTQAEHAVNMTPDRINVLMARAEDAINGLNSVNASVKKALLNRYRKSLENEASKSIAILTNRMARRKYIEQNVSNRTETIESFFNQLLLADRAGRTPSTIENIEMIVDMFTNPDAYRLLSTFKSPDLEFNGLTPLPQFDGILAKALSFFALPEIPSSQMHDIQLQKNLQSIDDTRNDFDEDYDLDVNPDSIIEAFSENFDESGKPVKKKLTGPQIIRFINAMSDSQFNDVINPFIMDRYLIAERTPERTKALMDAFKQNNTQPDFLYRFVGSQLMNALTPVPTNGDPSIRNTSVFDEFYPTKDVNKEGKAYDVIYEANLPVLLASMNDPYVIAAKDISGNEQRIPTGNLTNFYYSHDPMTDSYRVNRRKNLIGMVLGKTKTGKLKLDEFHDRIEEDINENGIEPMRSVEVLNVDQDPGFLSAMIKELPALLGDEIVINAEEIVDRINEEALLRKDEARQRIEQLRNQLELVKNEGRAHLLEKLIERNRQVMDVVKSQLLFNSKEADSGLGEEEARSTLRSIADRISNYIISERSGLHRSSYNLSQKLKSNANSYLKSYKTKIASIHNLDQEIINLFDNKFKDNYVVDNETFNNLLARRNALVTQAEIYRAEYAKIAAMELMGELVNPAYAFGVPNGDVQSYINRAIGGVINFGKIKYRTVTPFDEDSTPSAIFRSISDNLITQSKKNSAIIGVNRAMRASFASELLNGITSREAADLFSSLGPDLNKNFSVQNGYLDSNFKSDMVKEFFSRLKGESVISKYAKTISKKIKEDTSEDGIRRFVANTLSKDSNLSKLFADEFIVTDVESSGSQNGKRILDGNIEEKIESITSEIERLEAFLNSNQSNPNELSNENMPQANTITLFDMPSYRDPDQAAAQRRLNQGFSSARKLNVKIVRSLNRANLTPEQIENVNAITRDAMVINEAMNLFLEAEGEAIYRALTEEIDLYGEGFDTRQNIQNVIELAQLRKNLDTDRNNKFELMLQEMADIDTILNEADQPALALYGMTLRDMLYMNKEAATVTIGKDATFRGERDVTMRDKLTTESNFERIKQSALFIKNQAGLSIYMPTEGKLTEKEDKSYLVYERSALNHLKSYLRVTKQKDKSENLLKDAIFRASRGTTGFETFLRTQSHEEIKLDLNAPINPLLAKAANVSPTTTKGQFIKTAKRLFNEYFLKEKGNYTFSEFAKGIEIFGAIKRSDRMDNKEIQAAFDSIYNFASNPANDSVLQNSGFARLKKAKKDYSDSEKSKIVKDAYDVVIAENKFLTPDSHVSNSILLNESMFEDIITMLESDRFSQMNANDSLGAYQIAAINSIASVFSNQANTANSTSGKFFNSDTAIARLDLRHNYSRLYSLLYAEEIFADLISGVVESNKNDDKSIFTHSNALIRAKFARNFGAYQRALSLQGLIEQGINGNAGRNKYAAKYQEYQVRMSKASEKINNDFDLGARANLVATVKGILEANERDGGADLDLAMKLHYFASAYRNGIRDHRSTLRQADQYKKQKGIFSRFYRTMEGVARKQSREDVNINVINSLIESEIETIARRDPKSVTRQQAISYINQIENILYDGFEASKVDAMREYESALLSEFTSIFEGHRIANVFASESVLRDISDIVDPNVSKTASTYRKSYSVIPLRFGYVKNPLIKKDESVGSSNPAISEFIGFEQSLLNYRGRSIYDPAKENYVNVLRPIDLNPFTAPDQIASDAIYRMYLNPSYTVIQNMLGRYSVDENGIHKTDKGHLIGAIQAIYNIGDNSNIDKIGQYNQISAYIIDKINNEIRNDMPMDLADSVIADIVRVSNVHLMVRSLYSLIQPFTQGVIPALGKYLSVKGLSKLGIHKKDGARLREAYALVLKGYFGDKSLSNFVKENSTLSHKWQAEGGNKRDLQIDKTKYASQYHVTYLTRLLASGVNNIGEGLLDAVIGNPERALVSAIYAFELFNELQKEMGSSAPKTIKEMLNMNPDEFSTYSKTKADIMVTDYMGIGDRAKKAKIYNLPKKYALTTLLLNGLTRYGNHSLTVGPNLMVNTHQLYKQIKGDYNDRQMRNEAIENIVGTVLQGFLYRMAQLQVAIPNLAYLYFVMAGLFGGADDEERLGNATQRTIQFLKDIDVSGEVDQEDDTFTTLLSRRLRSYAMPEQFSVTRKDNRHTKFFAWEMKNSPILDNNLNALRRSALDVLPMIPKAGSSLSVPVINTLADVFTDIAATATRKKFDQNDLDRQAYKFTNMAAIPTDPLWQSYKATVNTTGVVLNRFAPKEGMEGISNEEFVEGMLTPIFGSREWRREYYGRIKEKGGWGIGK